MADAELITTIAELRTRLDSIRAGGGRVGLVPTMGALHAGHGSLITRAASETDLVVATVFVNPLQFAPTEDLAAYPRDLQVDRALASSCGAAVVFAPSVEEMYPFGADRVLTEVRVSEVSGPLEGERRPGHFAGVATVVAKLFAIGGACRAYFGVRTTSSSPSSGGWRLTFRSPLKSSGVRRCASRTGWPCRAATAT